MDRGVGEERPHVAHQLAVAQRVPASRGHLVHAGAVRVGADGGDVDDRRHHQVHRDHVDDPLGDARELLQQATGVADDDRVGHAEAADPARARLGHGRLDDGRANDADRHPAPVLQQRPFAQSLGVRVGIGPAERRGPGHAGLHQLVLHPLHAQLLGALGQQRHPGCAQLLPGSAVHLGQHRRRAADGIEVGTGPAGGGHLAPPVNVRGVGRVVEGRLVGLAATGAGHVGGRDGHHVGVGAQLLHDLHHPDRAQEVDLDRLVQGRVERHRCRRVDEDVGSAQVLAARLVKAQPVDADVASDRHQPASHLFVEPVAQLRPQAVEGVVLQHFAAHPVGGPPATRPHQNPEGAARHLAQQPLDERRAEEAGGAAEDDPLPVEGFGDHAVLLSTIWSVPAAAPAAVPTRTRVIDAAVGLFGTRGFEATSLDQVAEACGVRKQTLLYHFGDKGGLLEAVIDRTAAELAAALERGLSRPGLDGWAQVEAVVRATFRLAAQRPALLGLVREVSRLGGPAAARLTRSLEPLVHRATGFLEAEMATGRIRAQDPRLVLLAAYSTVVGAATEVEVLRALGYPPTARSVALRRTELLAFLRQALC